MSKTQQVLDAITANPWKPYAFYKAQLGFPPGFALMTLRTQKKIDRTGAPKSYLYGPKGANGDALSITQEVAAIHAAKKKRTKKPTKSVPPKEPSTVEKAMIRMARVPLAQIARKGYAAMHVPDALLASIAVHNALEGKLPAALLGNVVVTVYNTLNKQ